MCCLGGIGFRGRGESPIGGSWKVKCIFKKISPIQEVFIHVV